LQPDIGSLSKNVNHSCSSEVGSCCAEHCTYQATSFNHQSTAISSNGRNSGSSGAQLNAGGAVSSITDNVEASSAMTRSNFVDDRSWYNSTSTSNTALSQFITDSCELRETEHRSSSSDFYSMSSHYSTRSRLTLPDSGCVPSTSSAFSTLTSHSTQHRQNIIEISKPFESSDVLRYSEKLRRQRLNSTMVATAEIL